MYRIIHGPKRESRDVSAFLARLDASAGLFERGRPIFAARAPGRLDLMGGIADYSGSLVLEMPIAEAAIAALQIQEEKQLNIVSLRSKNGRRPAKFEMALSAFERAGRPIEYAEARSIFRKNAADHWAAYVAGAFLVLMRERQVRFDKGARIIIDSQVPRGKGVSSSAALEVAVMTAVCAAFSMDIEPRELALLCQKVENLVVGAPCGVMDQISSACGEAGRLLPILCQPAEILRPVAIPPELSVWGIDSGIRHSVGFGSYGSVRAGAFMGYRMIAEMAGLEATADKGYMTIMDQKWNGYLANITPDEFERDFARGIPKTISGADFLHQYDGITDMVTQVAPNDIYAVFEPTKHPIYEHARVARSARILQGPIGETEARELGELMLASHEGYSACGLGTQGTDLIVELVKRTPELYGAKITGGGSGGTVAILGPPDAEPAVRRIAKIYAEQTGRKAYIFRGSSFGAAEFGHVEAVL